MKNKKRDKKMYIAQLTKRLLGFYQTPCTILDGVQYSWPIPLDGCHTGYEPIDRLVVCLDGIDIMDWLTAIDHPIHSDTHSDTQPDGGGTSREELE